ncbi:hypothetical protein TorRG33x02_297590, partial [Trema orientale]
MDHDDYDTNYYGMDDGNLEDKETDNEINDGVPDMHEINDGVPNMLGNDEQELSNAN